MADRVRLAVPLDPDFASVVRVVVGGVAERGAMTFGEMDDLQLALERLLDAAGDEGRVGLSFELGADSVRTRVGPLRERRLADALQVPREPFPSLTLRRVLDTVVDSFGIEEAVDNTIVVRLEKIVRGPA